MGDKDGKYLDKGEQLEQLGETDESVFWGGGDLVLDDLEEFAVDLNGGASDVLDFATDDGSFAFYALYVGFDALHVAAEDPDLLAFFQRGRIGGDFLASALYELAVVFQLGVGDSVDVFATGHGEHLIDIGTKPDFVEIFLADVAENEGREEDAVFLLSLVGALIHDEGPFRRYPVLKPDRFVV